MNDAPWRALVALARREGELIAARDWEELGRLAEEWEELVASLPPAGPEARADLEEAKVLAEANAAQLAVALEAVRSELGHRVRNRHALSAYTRAAGAE